MEVSSYKQGEEEVVKEIRLEVMTDYRGWCWRDVDGD